jgi:hypothetical protein
MASKIVIFFEFYSLNTPFPTFPHGGRSRNKASRLGGTGKEVLYNKMEVVEY